MAMRPVLLSVVVGIAALGASWSPDAQARGSISVSVGTGSPYYGGYGRTHHRPGYVLVPGHWVSTYRGRVWVPAQYVRVRGHGYDRGYGYGQRPYYRSSYPRGYDPRYDGPRRGW
ncbi:MAG: hypothetical protein ACREPE_12075 [Lysobacter sp.]